MGRWWAEARAAFAAGLPAGIPPPAAPLSALLDLADGVPDTEFLDKLEWVSAPYREGME